MQRNSRSDLRSSGAVVQEGGGRAQNLITCRDFIGWSVQFKN